MKKFSIKARQFASLLQFTATFCLIYHLSISSLLVPSVQASQQHLLCNGNARVIYQRDYAAMVASGSSNSNYRFNPSATLQDGSFNGSQNVNQNLAFQPQIASSGTHYKPQLGLDFSSCPIRRPLIRTVYIANSEWNTDTLKGAQLLVLRYHGQPLSWAQTCENNIQDGGFFVCDKVGVQIILVQTQGISQLEIAEMRAYGSTNVADTLQASIVGTSGYLPAFSPTNLIQYQNQRTTSSQRQITTAAAAVVGAPQINSCAIFTEFPVSFTIDLGAPVFVQSVLFVGNAANPLSSFNFQIFAGMSASSQEPESECGKGWFLPSDHDYMTVDTRLGLEASCQKRANFVTLYKAEADAGQNTFEVCTFGVMASCSCQDLQVEYPYGKNPNQDQTIVLKQGANKVWHIQSPKYSNKSGTIPGTSCSMHTYDCIFQIGLKIEGDQTALNLISNVINNGINFNVPQNQEPGDYQIEVSLYDQQDESKTIRQSFPMLVQVIKYVQIPAFNMLPARVFRKDHSMFEKWRVLEGYDIRKLPQPIILRKIYVSNHKMAKWVQFSNKSLHFSINKYYFRKYAEPGVYFLRQVVTVGDEQWRHISFIQTIMVMPPLYKPKPALPSIQDTRPGPATPASSNPRNPPKTSQNASQSSNSSQTSGSKNPPTQPPAPPRNSAPSDPKNSNTSSTSQSGSSSTTSKSPHSSGTNTSKSSSTQTTSKDDYRKPKRGEKRDHKKSGDHSSHHKSSTTSSTPDKQSTSKSGNTSAADPTNQQSSTGSSTSSTSTSTSTSTTTQNTSSSGSSSQQAGSSDSQDFTVSQPSGTGSQQGSTSSTNNSSGSTSQSQTVGAYENSDPNFQVSLLEKENPSQDDLNTIMDQILDPSKELEAWEFQSAAQASQAIFEMDFGAQDFLDMIQDAAVEEEEYTTRDEILDDLYQMDVDFDEEQDMFEVVMSEVDSNGRIEFDFSSPVDTDILQKYLEADKHRSQVISVILQRGDEVISLPWEVESVGEAKLVIKVVNEALEEMEQGASMLVEDFVIVEVKEPHVFISKNRDKMLNPLSLYDNGQNKASLSAMSSLPSLDFIANVDMTTVAQVTSQSTMQTAATSLASSAVIGTPAGPGLSIVYYVQNMMNVPAMNVETPDNVKEKMSMFKDMANIDLEIDFQTIFGSIFKSGENEKTQRRLKAVSEKAQGASYLGYPSQDGFVKNMGIFKVLVIAWAISAIFFCILWTLTLLCKKQCGRSKFWSAIFGWFKEVLFFKSLIFVALIGCTQIFISAFQQLSSEDVSVDEAKSGESSFDSKWALIVLIVYGCLIIGCFVLLRIYRNQLYSRNFESKFGALSGDCRKGSIWCLLYPVFFILKRAAIAILLVSGHRTAQVLGLILLQLAYCSYLVGVKPLYKRERSQEVLQEYALVLLSYFMLLFAGHYANSKLMNAAGVIEMGLCLVLLIYRVLYITFYLLKSIYFRIKWFVKKCKEMKKLNLASEKNQSRKETQLVRNSKQGNNRRGDHLGIIQEQSMEVDDEDFGEGKQSHRRQRRGGGDTISRYQRIINTTEVASHSPIKKQHKKGISSQGSHGHEIDFNPTAVKTALNKLTPFQQSAQIEAERADEMNSNLTARRIERLKRQVSEKQQMTSSSSFGYNLKANQADTYDIYDNGIIGQTVKNQYDYWKNEDSLHGEQKSNDTLGNKADRLRHAQSVGPHYNTYKTPQQTKSTKQFDPHHHQGQQFDQLESSANNASSTFSSSPNIIKSSKHQAHRKAVNMYSAASRISAESDSNSAFRLTNVSFPPTNPQDDPSMNFVSEINQGDTFYSNTSAANTKSASDNPISKLEAIRQRKAINRQGQY